MFDKLKERLEKARISAEKLATENLLISKVSPEVRQQRLDICLSCDKLYKPTHQCKLCGCFMGVKTWMTEQACPARKWGPGEEHSKGKIED